MNSRIQVGEPKNSKPCSNARLFFSSSVPYLCRKADFQSLQHAALHRNRGVEHSSNTVNHTIPPAQS